METVFLITATILIGFTASIWEAKGVLNIIIKLVYSAGAIWAAALTCIRLGIIA